MLTVLPVLGRLAYRLARDQRVPRRHRAVMLASAAYAVSPVDIATDLIPVFGRLDDLLVLALGIAWVLRTAPPAVVDEHLAALGLTRKELAAKIAAVVPPPMDRAVARYEEVLPEIEATGRSLLDGAGEIARLAGGAAVWAVVSVATAARRAARAARRQP
jgi:uncharacterized membrane protein YkvA (DUF1232 family)